MSDRKTIENIINKVLIPSYPVITNFDLYGTGVRNEYDRKYTIILEIPVGDFSVSLVENIMKDFRLMLTMIGFNKIKFETEGTKNYTYIIRTFIY
jgi:hypothetical protein